jgi:hypothetical protein
MAGELKIGDAELFHTLGDLRVLSASVRDAGEIAFDIGHECRHADTVELFGDDPERYGLTRAFRPGNQPVAIGHARQ